MITNEELAAWVAGEADPAVAARVESALPLDLDLTARIESIRATDALLAGMPDVAPSEEATERIAMAARRAASNHLDLEAARAGTAGAGDAAGRAGARGGIDWTGWTARVAALTAIVVLVGVGVGLERGTILGTRLEDSAVDGGDEAVSSQVAAGDAAESGEAESMDAAADTAETAGGEDEAGDDAVADTTVAAPQELEQAEADEPAAGTEAAADVRSVPGGRIGDQAWSDIVGDATPVVLPAAQGDVLVLPVGSRMDLLFASAELPREGGETFDGDADAAFRSPPTTMSAATVADWSGAVRPAAAPVDPDSVERGDDVATMPELVDACLARRDAAVAGMDPPAPPIEVVITGTTAVGGLPLQALVDSDGGIVVVDAVTCEPR